MTIKLIPTRNVLLDEEKIFLNDMLKKGLILRNKGLFFYHFEKKDLESIHNLSNNILLIDNGENSSSLNLSSAKILMKKINKKANTTVLYALTDKESRWLSDDSYLLKWYQNRQGIYLNFANLFGFIAALIFVLAITPFNMPTFIFLLSPFFCALAIPNLRKSDFCFDGAKKITYEMGKLTGFEAEYFLSFFKNIDVKDIESEISLLGYCKKVAENTYRIKTPMSKNELIDFIMEAGNLKITDFSIVHSGELYVP